MPGADATKCKMQNAKLKFIVLAHEFIIKNYKLQMKVFPSEIIINDGQSPYLSL